MSRRDDERPAGELHDRWPIEREDEASHEPDAFDPHSIGPDVPSVSSVEDDLDTGVARLFWFLVVVFNVAILALALGPMLVYFRGQWDLGLRIFFAGVVVFAYGVFRYYRYQLNMADEAEHNG